MDSGMQATYKAIAEEILEILHKNNDQQVLIGVVGPPGVGKSTTAQRLSQLISRSVVVPMDGFHFYKSELDKFENVSEAYKRRGSHWTFNGEKFLQKLSALKTNHKGLFPSFDHGDGDPIEDDIVVTNEHKVVIVEGNYLCLDIAPWNEITSLLNFTYFLDCDLRTIEQRVYNRHMSLGYGEEVSRKRVEENDSPNAQLVLTSKHRSNKVIQSV